MDLTFPQAEEAVIGAILIDGDAVLPELMQTLRAEDFSDQTLRHIFEAAAELWSAKKPVDPVTIGAALGVSDSYGQIAAAIMQRTPTAANATEYAAIVRERAQLRTLQSVGLSLANCSTLDEARELFSRAATLSGERGSMRARKWRDLAMEFMSSLDAKPDEYLSLGIPQLTDAARVQRGQYVVLGAYNSVGKTALSLQMAFALADSGLRVGYFSLETADELLTRRVFAQQAQTRMRAIQDHRLSKEEVLRSTEVTERSWNYELELIEAAGCTVAEIRAATLAKRLEVIFIDYVQLLTTGDNITQELRGVSIALRTLAQTLGVTVVVLSQVTLPQRDPKKKQRPYLTKENLRESQQLANDADVVLLLDLSDPNDYESNRVLLMDKNKDVGQARMLLRFDGPRLTFSYLPPIRDSEQEKADARNAIMDANRAKRQEKEAAAGKDAIDGQGTFEALPDNGEGLPF